MLESPSRTHPKPLLEDIRESLSRSYADLPARHVGHAPVSVGVFVLANTILGAGMLGLPAAFAGCGYIAGVLGVLLFGGSAVLGLFLLSEAANLVGRPATFHSVANAAVPGFGHAFDAAIAIKCFGVATSYLIVVKGNMPAAMIALGAPRDHWLTNKQLWVLLSAGLATPLAFLRSISRLRFTAVLSITCVILIISVVLLFCAHPIPALDPCPTQSEVAALGSPERNPSCGSPTLVPFTSPISCLRELPIFVFSYTCHQNAISVTNELRNPTSGRALLGMSTAVSIAMVAYLALAMGGYATFGADVKGDVLESYPSDSLVVGVARMAISLIVTLCYPLQCHPSRGCLTSIFVAVGEGLCSATNQPASVTPIVPITMPLSSTIDAHAASSGRGREDADEALRPDMRAGQVDVGAYEADSASAARPLVDDHSAVPPFSLKAHIGITCAFLLSSIVIGLLVDDLGVVLRVVGATGSTTVSYILPGGCYFVLARTRARGSKRLRIAAAVMLLAGLVIMPLSLTLIFLPI